MKNLFTIIITFSNRAKVIEQYEEKTPLEALIRFVRHSDTLEGYNREHMEESLTPLHHSTRERGVWAFSSNSKRTGITGGTIVQTDKSAYLRPHH